MNELAGAALPSQKFGANAPWLRLNVILYNLLSAYKRVGRPEEFHTARPKRLPCGDARSRVGRGQIASPRRLGLVQRCRLLRGASGRDAASLLAQTDDAGRQSSLARIASADLVHRNGLGPGRRPRLRHTTARPRRLAPSSAMDAGSGIAAGTSVITTSPLPVWKSASRIRSVPASNEPPPPPGTPPPSKPGPPPPPL